MSPGRATGSPAGTGHSPRSAKPWTVANATWTNTIGSLELSAVWKNPDLKPEERAFYYGLTSLAFASGDADTAHRDMKSLAGLTHRERCSS